MTTPRTCDPSALLWIDVSYTTRDRFGPDRHGDPDAVFAQIIEATIDGVVLGAHDEPLSLGTMTLGRIDLWEADELYRDVLDCHSGAWEAYIPVIEEFGVNAPRYLLIVDRVTIHEWVRGHGIGLHAVARALLTWAEDALVLLTACPVEGPDDARDAGAEALATYWARLGLDRQPETHPPQLTGETHTNDVRAALAALCEWTAPDASDGCR